MKSTIGIAKLTAIFDAYAPDVLAPRYIRLIHQPRGKPRKYDIIEPLPNKADYLVARDARYRRSADAIVNDAYSVFDEIKEELESWHGNLPVSLQTSGKGEAIEHAASELGNLSEPHDAELFDKLMVVDLPDLSGRNGREHRVGVAADQLRAVAEALLLLQTGPGAAAILEAHPKDFDTADDVVARAAELASELESAADDAGVEIPGMY